MEGGAFWRKLGVVVSMSGEERWEKVNDVDFRRKSWHNLVPDYLLATYEKSREDS